MGANIFIFSIFIFLHQTITVHPLSNPNTGFTTNFIHREFSPLSPFYNPSHNRFDRIHNTIRRSFSRLSALSSSSSHTFQSRLSYSSFEYLMNLSIGTPPVTILAVADTGSDLTWIQCLPCIKCYKQNLPLFHSKNSTTYKSVPCSSRLCAALNNFSRICHKDNNCGYSLSYGDYSVAMGDLAQDSFTFESANGGHITFPNVAFGCGRNNKGRFDNSTSGIVGLGTGKLSIIRQLNNSVHGKFSYCLVPFTDKSGTSTINFGSNAVVTGEGVVSTPLIIKSPDTFYYVNLEKITVGRNKPIQINKTKDGDGDDGNIIIDSGSTLTFLHPFAYKDLESLVKKSMNVEFVKDPYGGFGLCYNSTKDTNATIPKITFHFTNADVDLPETTTFVESKEGVKCLSIFPTFEYAILGNFAQMGYLIGYDLVNSKVSFKPTDCTKQR